MSIFSRNKFKKLKREEVVDAIVELEKQQNEVMTKYNENMAEEKKLFEKGKRERDKNMQVFYAKKIQTMRAQNASIGKRLQFLNANTAALYKLKDAIDDNEFIASNSKLPLNALLNKPEQLTEFLSKVNIKKSVMDEKLENTLNIFEEVESAYDVNEKIYGEDEGVNNILSMFESANMDIEYEGEAVYEAENKQLEAGENIN